MTATNGHDGYKPGQLVSYWDGRQQVPARVTAVTPFRVIVEFQKPDGGWVKRVARPHTVMPRSVR